MAAPNYKFAKRQRELKKSQKQEAKRQKKLAEQPDAPETKATTPESP